MGVQPLSEGTIRALAGLERYPPISEEGLSALVAYVAGTFETTLPDDYIAFLRIANGADGELESGLPIVLWASDLLPEINVDNQTDAWMPSCMIIGSDAGDLVYGIDMRAEPAHERYVESEDVGLSWDYLLWQGRSFDDLIARVNRPLGSATADRRDGSPRARLTRAFRPGR